MNRRSIMKINKGEDAGMAKTSEQQISDSKLIVLAIGGNSLILDPRHVSVKAQYEAAEKTAAHVARLIQQGHRVVIAHGNGPQVGFILRRTELAKHELHTVPLDSCVADTQGAIGYNLQMAVRNELKKMQVERTIATIVTQVIVSPGDPSFQKPTKPIGSFMTSQDAEHHQLADGWSVVEDAGRGYRRVVPSPKPLEIVELEVVRTLAEQGVIVIAAGGGGIPVVERKDSLLEGKEAVIDKDFAACLLAKSLHADLFLISTAVPHVSLNFGKENQIDLDTMSVSQAEQYTAEGQFAAGSMLPKIEAMVDFVRHTGNQGIITDPEHLSEAVQGKAGTQILK